MRLTLLYAQLCEAHRTITWPLTPRCPRQLGKPQVNCKLGGRSGLNNVIPIQNNPKMGYRGIKRWVPELNEVLKGT